MQKNIYMSKLLTEPRVPKEITTPKNPTRKKKVLEEDRSEVKYTLLHESDKKDVDELFRVYKESPFNARVKFFNDKKQICFTRKVIFERGNDFEICDFRVSFGISITNRIYSSQKKIQSIIYKSGKFYYKVNEGRNKKFIPLMYNHLMHFSGSGVLEKLRIFLSERFFWFEAIHEYSSSHHLNLNVVKAKKLFGNKALSQYIFGVPYSVCKLITEHNILGKLHDYGSPYKVWKSYLPYLKNIDKVNPELITSHYFHDTVRMAKTLGRKVNCVWGLKRLKEEHDTWAREIGNIVLDCSVEYNLNIRKEFIKFAGFSKYKLLSTNKDLLIEGMIQNHCVGTYISRVNKGECAIYNVDGYTLQLMIGDFLVDRPNERVSDFTDKQTLSRLNTFKKLYIAQFKGKYNSNVPNDVLTSVIKIIDTFNLINPIEELCKFIPVETVDDGFLF